MVIREILTTEGTIMRATLAAAVLALALAGPASATDAGNANAEQQTQPTPNRGGTAGGPAHDMRDKAPAHEGGRADAGGAAPRGAGKADAQGHRH